MPEAREKKTDELTTLVDMHPGEISIVTRGANRKPLVVIKHDKHDEEQHMATAKNKADDTQAATPASVVKGAAFAALLTSAVQARVDAGEDRANVLDAMTAESGLTLAEVEALLTGFTACPLMTTIEGLSRALGTPTADLVAAAETDGCSYATGEPGATDTSGAAATDTAKNAPITTEQNKTDTQGSGSPAVAASTPPVGVKKDAKGMVTSDVKEAALDAAKALLASAQKILDGVNALQVATTADISAVESDWGVPFDLRKFPAALSAEIMAAKSLLNALDSSVPYSMGIVIKHDKGGTDILHGALDALATSVKKFASPAVPAAPSAKPAERVQPPRSRNSKANTGPVGNFHWPEDLAEEVANKNAK